MLKGVILNGGRMPVMGVKTEEIFKDENVVVIVNEDRREIYVWVGAKSNPRDRFMGARLANGLRWKFFGGASPVIQDNEKIREIVKSYGDKLYGDIPSEMVKDILGI
ncbi:MAG: hypothetical protein ACP6IP_02835 [Candidatus Njordarchaeia archaeon]